MAGYGKRRAVLLRTKEPTLGHIQLGKICRIAGSPIWVYANNISASYREGAEFGIAPCVIELMKAWDVNWVNYYDANEGVVYGASLLAICRFANVKSYSYRPKYYYLEIAEWGKSKRRRYEFVPEGRELFLDWGEEILRPAQVDHRANVPGTQPRLLP